MFIGQSNNRIMGIKALYVSWLWFFMCNHVKLVQMIPWIKLFWNKCTVLNERNKKKRLLLPVIHGYRHQFYGKPANGSEAFIKHCFGWRMCFFFAWNLNSCNDHNRDIHNTHSLARLTKKNTPKWQKWQTTKLRQNKNLFIEFRRKTKHYSFPSPLISVGLFFFLVVLNAFARSHPTIHDNLLDAPRQFSQILWYCTETVSSSDTSICSTRFSFVRAQSNEISIRAAIQVRKKNLSSLVCCCCVFSFGWFCVFCILFIGIIKIEL